LIYLPPGASVSRDTKNGSPSGTQTPTILETLFPNSTVVTLKYRLSTPTHVFPVPIHDTAVAFKHILTTLTNDDAPKISLLGSRIGGTLATTLALTSPNPIHSVAVSEPILDWVSLDTGTDDHTDDPTLTRRKSRPKHYTTSDAKSLLNLRTRLFPKPDSYFDPFASPILFLRAPGRDCPQPYLDPLASPGSSNSSEAFGQYEDDAHTRFHSSPSSSPSADREDDAATLKPIKRRKVLRRWPPNAPPESVQLPHFRFFVGDDQEGEGMVVRQQAEELVELMRRVCFYGQEREVGEQRVGLNVLPRKEREGDHLGMEQAARWLARKHEEQE
jgi:pimeloyl-ACP methyl ester carboxylesterase